MNYKDHRQTREGESPRGARNKPTLGSCELDVGLAGAAAVGCGDELHALRAVGQREVAEELQGAARG